VREAALTKPVLMVTHDTSEITELADRALQASGPPLYVSDSNNQLNRLSNDK